MSIFRYLISKASSAVPFATVSKRDIVQDDLPNVPPPPPPLQQPFLGLSDEDLSKEREVEMIDPELRHQRARRDAVKETGNSDRIPYPPSPILRPTGPGAAIYDPPFSLSSNKPHIGYAGYILTSQPAKHVGQRAIWAIANKELMVAAQADLESQVEKNCKRGITVLDQYMDMKGSKRKQIDELIRECARMDPDPRFEYIIASIKRDTRIDREISTNRVAMRNEPQSGRAISTMQVILKRQPRAGIDMQGPPFMGFGSIRLPSSGLVDVSYHYSWTDGPYSLSSGATDVAERSLPSDAADRANKSWDEWYPPQS